MIDHRCALRFVSGAVVALCFVAVSSPTHAETAAPEKSPCVELLIAAENGNRGQVIRLLDQGVSIDCAGPRHSATALHWAAYKGHVGVVKTLIERGATIDARNSDGRTPLILAAGMGHAKTARILLEAGADRNATGADGLTALDWAKKKRRRRVVRALAPPREKKPTAQASRITGGGKPRSVETRVTPSERAAKSAPDRDAAFLAAAYAGDVKRLKALLQQGADIEARDALGNTALILAAAAGHTEAVKLLLKRGANPSAAQMVGLTAADWAERSGDADLRALLTK